MQDEVTLHSRRHDGALTTFSVSTGWGSTIVFNEGTYYPPVRDAGAGMSSREYDRYLVVETKNLPVLARQLGIDGAAGIGAVFAAVVESARASGVADLAGARLMLQALEVPFGEDTWISR